MGVADSGPGGRGGRVGWVGSVVLAEPHFIENRVVGTAMGVVGRSPQLVFFVAGAAA